MTDQTTGIFVGLRTTNIGEQAGNGAVPTVRKPRRPRSEATDHVITQFAEMQSEIDAREALQFRNQEKGHTNKLVRLWSHFPEGIGLVMRAADTARRSHLYRNRLPFLLTRPEVDGLMIRSKGRCEVSGIPFSGQSIPGCHRRPFVPSIDRIKAKEAYTYSNTRLVCCAVNIAVNEWGDAVFWQIMRAAAARYDEDYMKGLHAEPLLPLP